MVYLISIFNLIFSTAFIFTEYNFTSSCNSMSFEEIMGMRSQSSEKVTRRPRSRGRGQKQASGERTSSYRGVSRYLSMAFLLFYL